MGCSHEDTTNLSHQDTKTRFSQRVSRALGTVSWCLGVIISVSVSWCEYPSAEQPAKEIHDRLKSRLRGIIFVYANEPGCQHEGNDGHQLDQDVHRWAGGI